MARALATAGACRAGEAQAGGWAPVVARGCCRTRRRRQKWDVEARWSWVETVGRDRCDEGEPG